MTKSETITKFQLYMDDTSDLSSQETSDLYDKVLARVYRTKPWEILRNVFSGTQSTSVPYIALPTGFAFLMQNGNHTDESYEAQRPVVFVGSAYDRYQVISMGDRRQYRNQKGYAYIDIAASNLVFTYQPGSADAVEYDYAKIPSALSLSDSPVFPSDFHDIVYHGMCVDDFIIQQSDKAKSYAVENQNYYKKYLDDISYWNANLIQL